jgi:hypothetical protein
MSGDITMADNPIRSADDLIGFIEADAVCLPGVRMCDVDLVTGALRVLMADGRQFEVIAVEVNGDD